MRQLSRQILKQAVKAIETRRAPGGLRCSVSFSLPDTTSFAGVFEDVLPNSLYKELKLLGMTDVSIQPLTGEKNAIPGSSRELKTRAPSFYN